MKMLCKCTNGCDTSVNVQFSDAYFGPEITCGKCNSVMLMGSVTIPFISVQHPSSVASGAAQQFFYPTGTAPTLTATTQVSGQTSFFWPPRVEVVDAEHVSTCVCNDCVSKVK